MWLVYLTFRKYQNICPNLVMVGNGPCQDFLKTYNIMSLHPMKHVLNILGWKNVVSFIACDTSFAFGGRSAYHRLVIVTARVPCRAVMGCGQKYLVVLFYKVKWTPKKTFEMTIYCGWF